MAAQGLPLGEAQSSARRRFRALRGTALLAAAAALALLLAPQLRWMHPLCGSNGGGRGPQRVERLGIGQQQQQQEAAPLPPGFRFNRVVAIIAFDRFEYFRQVVDALRQAWGSEEYILTITIDGPPQGAAEAAASAAAADGDTQQQQPGGYSREGHQAILAYAQNLQWLARNGRGRFRDVVVNASDVNLGVWPNKKRAVAGALALSDFAVILEDDIVLERDALRWFEWHVTSGLIFQRPELAVATCWSSSFPYHATAVEGHDLLVAREMGLLDKYWVRLAGLHGAGARSRGARAGGGAGGRGSAKRAWCAFWTPSVRPAGRVPAACSRRPLLLLRRAGPPALGSLGAPVCTRA